MGKPYSTCYSYGEEFLLFYAYALVFVKVHTCMGRPPVLKPFPIKISPKTDRTESISVQIHVWGQGDGSVEEKGMPIPLAKEGFPHINVLEKFFVKADVKIDDFKRKLKNIGTQGVQELFFVT